MDRKRTGNLICCVVGCHNTYGNNKEVKLYRFPNRPWEKERKEQWISAVKRLDENMKRWIPKSWSRICNFHFVDGKKSEDPRSPSYIPTIFPKTYKQKKSQKGSSQAKARFERLKNRNKKRNVEKKLQEDGHHILSNDIESNTEILELSMEEELSLEMTKDFGCQVIPVDGPINENTFVFNCSHEGNSVATEACLPFKPAFQKFATSTSAGSQTDEVYFIGYNAIQKEQQLLEIGGVTFAVFQMLLGMLNVAAQCRLSKENILLLFLMKVKLGLNYTALSYFFGLHRTTCARTFLKVLAELYIKTTNFVFWPSKSTVQLLLPEAFRRNFPKCRVIIDCTEIKTEEPPRADQRVFLYSSYKHAYTVKFLIGITPNGFISFKSKCYGGRTSDGFIVNDSNFLNLLEAEDEVLADKGFPKIVTDSRAIIVIPPMLQHGRFSEAEVEETYNIASVRIHVERAIQRVKVFNILRKIPVTLLRHVDKIVHVCCALANLQPPIIKSLEDDDIEECLEEENEENDECIEEENEENDECIEEENDENKENEKCQEYDDIEEGVQEENEEEEEGQTDST